VKALLEKLLDRVDLTEAEAGELLDGLTSVSEPDARKGAVLAALRAKGETGAELRGLAMAMRRRARTVSTPPGRPVVDTSGTGGDASHSINLSTSTALLVAAGGITVAKHGNRSVSSRAGSADVVEALGLRLANNPEEARQQLVDTGFTFLFAPSFHPATASLANVRRHLGVRTAFNLLGPLTNPAAPTHQLVGAATPDAARRIADALSGMPVERAFVVHGSPSWDEATPCGPFLRIEVRGGLVRERILDPEVVYDLPRCPPSALAGGDASDNARAVEAIFSGARTAARDAILLNTALVFELLDPALAPTEALRRAAEILDSGRATWFLERLRAWK
jgi:anthranilate phosphoribosyltransferase